MCVFLRMCVYVERERKEKRIKWTNSDISTNLKLYIHRQFPPVHGVRLLLKRIELIHENRYIHEINVFKYQSKSTRNVTIYHYLFTETLNAKQIIK